MKEKLTGERGGMGAQTICLLLGHFSVLEPEFGLFYYPFHSCATVVARKRSSSFGQKCRWQVKAKHTHTPDMWLRTLQNGPWIYGVHRTCTEMASVSRGISHTTKQRCKHNTSVDHSNALCKDSHSGTHATRAH